MKGGSHPHRQIADAGYVSKIMSYKKLPVSFFIDLVRVESAVSLSLWQQCLARLQDELPATEFSMWIRPLQAELSDNTLALYAPNRLCWIGFAIST